MDRDREVERWPLGLEMYASVGDTWGSGLEVVIEGNPGPLEEGVARVGEPAENKLSEKQSDASPILKVGLLLCIEQIPRLIAVLNEIYKRHYEEALDEIRQYWESISGQNDDLIADLRAYRVFADGLSEFAEKLGYFSDTPR